MNLQDIMQMAWKFLAPQKMFNGMANDIMDKALQAGKEKATPDAVVQIFKGIAKRNGWDGMINEYGHILDAFANKSKDEVIPHAMNIIKTQGILPTVISFLSSKK